MAKLTQRLGLTRYEADELYKQALQHYDKRDLEEAILTMDEVIKLLPTNAEYYAARGFFYMQDGIDDKALVDYEQALKIYPYEMLAHYGRGVIAYRQRKWEDAANHFLQAHRIDQQRPETLYHLALTYHRMGRNDMALRAMQLAAQNFGERHSKSTRRNADRWVKEFTRLLENA